MRVNKENRSLVCKFEDQSSNVFVLHKMKVVVEGRLCSVRAAGYLEKRRIGVDRFARVEVVASTD